MLDLVVLVADKNMLHAVRGILRRHDALGTRPIRFDLIPHPHRDGGVRTTGVQLLGMKRSASRHALMMLDYDGSGCGQSALELESILDDRLANDWGDRGKTIVIEPELEAWVWGADGILREVLGWTQGGAVRDWVRHRGFEFDAMGKPTKPKEAFEAFLEHIRLPRSSALYEKLASRFSLQRCEDRSFGRLRQVLKRWFLDAGVQAGS